MTSEHFISSPIPGCGASACAGSRGATCGGWWCCPDGVPAHAERVPSASEDACPCCLPWLEFILLRVLCQAECEFFLNSLQKTEGDETALAGRRCSLFTRCVERSVIKRLRDE